MLAEQTEQACAMKIVPNQTALICIETILLLSSAVSDLDMHCLYMSYNKTVFLYGLGKLEDIFEMLKFKNKKLCVRAPKSSVCAHTRACVCGLCMCMTNGCIIFMYRIRRYKFNFIYHMKHNNNVNSIIIP